MQSKDQRRRLKCPLLLVFKCVLDLGEIKIFPCSSTENIQNIQTCGFKVRCRIIRLGNEQLVFGAILTGFKHIAYLDKLLLDWPQQGEAWLDFSLRISSLHCSGHHCDKPAFRGHLVSIAHHSYVDVRISSNLLLRNDDLRREGILKKEENNNNLKRFACHTDAHSNYLFINSNLKNLLFSVSKSF